MSLNYEVAKDKAQAFFDDAVNVFFFWCAILVAHLIQVMATRFGFPSEMTRVFNRVEEIAAEASFVVFSVASVLRFFYGQFRFVREWR